MSERRPKTTPWNGFVRLSATPYCPVCCKPLHVDAWALTSRLACCNRIECIAHPFINIALKLMQDQPGKYRVLNHVVGLFWTPTDPHIDLLQYDLANTHTLIG